MSLKLIFFYISKILSSPLFRFFKIYFLSFASFSQKIKIFSKLFFSANFKAFTIFFVFKENKIFFQDFLNFVASFWLSKNNSSLRSGK
jgi:hypothetical protein